MTTEIEKEILQRNFCRIIECIDVEDILPNLFEKGIITLDERERIEKIGITKRDKAKALVDKLLRSDNPNSFAVFLESLNEGHRDLAAHLRRQLKPSLKKDRLSNKLKRQEAIPSSAQESNLLSPDAHDSCCTCYGTGTAAGKAQQHDELSPKPLNGLTEPNYPVFRANSPRHEGLTLSGGNIHGHLPLTNQSISNSQPYCIPPQQTVREHTCAPVQEINYESRQHDDPEREQTLCKTLEEEERTLPKEIPFCMTHIEGVHEAEAFGAVEHDDGYSSSPNKHTDEPDGLLNTMKEKDQQENDLNDTPIKTVTSFKRKPVIKGDPRRSVKSEKVLQDEDKKYKMHRNISNESCEDNSLAPPKQFSLTLKKQNRKFGFSFVSGRPDGRPRHKGDRDYYVTKVEFGSVAAESGKMKIQDTIVSLNGHSVSSWKYDEVIDFLKHNDSVTVTLQHYNSD